MHFDISIHKAKTSTDDSKTDNSRSSSNREDKNLFFCTGAVAESSKLYVVVLLSHNGP